MAPYPVDEPPAATPGDPARRARFFEEVPDAIFVADVRGRYLDANRAALALLGYSLDELRALNVADVLIPAEHAVRSLVLGALQPTAPRVTGRSLRTGSGRVIPCELHTVALATGEILCVVRDVSERPSAEARIAEAWALHRDARWETLLDSALDAIVTVDDDHRVVLFNRAAEHIFGVPAGEALGGRLDRFIPPDALSRHEAGMRRFAAQPERMHVVPRAVPLRAVRVDGTIFPIEAAVSYSTTPAGGRLYTAIIRDVSDRERAEAERRRMEAALLHTQKLESLGVLAGGIAHDFNNILMSILGRAELALPDVPPVSGIADDLRQIRDAAERAAELCQQLLVYAGRGERGRPEPVEVEALVDEMAELLRISRAPGARLVLDLAGPRRSSPSGRAPRVIVDPALLRQVVLSVITNASEALEGNEGTIHVATRVVTRLPEHEALVADATEGPGPWLELAVSDSGAGMDAETLTRIFDPFFTTRFPGRGLGLSAVLGIVRGASGAVGVSSQIGRGTTFRIFLPIAPEPVPIAPPSEAARDWAGSGGILVVDDELVVLGIARRMLEQLGFKVFEALGAVEALEIAARERAILRGALVDLTMPEVDGVETIARVSALAPEIVCVLTSGYPPEHVEGRPTGARFFIKKPYTIGQLREIMRLALP